MPVTPIARRAVTRTDVARHAGVSTAVVSYVVNDGPRNVAPKTRDRVLDSIRELGYRPNHAARALKLGTNQIIGLVIPDGTNPYFAEYARAVETAAEQEGLSVIVVNSARVSGHEAKLMQRLVSRQVDGILFAASDDGADIDGAISAGIPVVVLNRAADLDGASSVGVDFFGASVHAVEHLIGHGHTRIGLIGGDSGGTPTSDREEGWRAALTAAGLAEGPIVHAEFSRAGGYAAGKALLQGDDPSTAIYVISDIQAMGLLRAVQEEGLRIPEDVAVISFDGSIESEYSWPPLTSMRQPVAAMAQAAIRALTQDRELPASHMQFETELVIRQSCGCAIH